MNRILCEFPVGRHFNSAKFSVTGIESHSLILKHLGRGPDDRQLIQSLDDYYELWWFTEPVIVDQFAILMALLGVHCIEDSCIEGTLYVPMGHSEAIPELIFENW